MIIEPWMLVKSVGRSGCYDTLVLARHEIDRDAPTSYVDHAPPQPELRAGRPRTPAAARHAIIPIESGAKRCGHLSSNEWNALIPLRQNRIG
jgi:hypothetical protein